ncbi:MAG: class I SAM-dependent methyltransferase [Gemmatimonadaceae bacterium]
MSGTLEGLRDRLRPTLPYRIGRAVYQGSGLKARLTARRLRIAVRTEPMDALLARLGRAGLVPAPEVAPPGLDVPGVSAGPMPARDVAAFTRLLSHVRPRTVLEIGTNWGCSTAMFALNTEDAARIWTVDVCREMFDEAALARSRELDMVLPRARTGEVYRRLPEARKVTQVFRDSRLLDWTESDFPPAFDLVFVDACHEYEFARSDTERAWPRVAPGGLLVWHDYYPRVEMWPGVFRAVNDFARAVAPVYHIAGTALAVAVKPAAGRQRPSRATAPPASP